MMGVWLLDEDRAETIEEPTVPVPPATATRILVSGLAQEVKVNWVFGLFNSRGFSCYIWITVAKRSLVYYVSGVIPEP